MARPRPHDSHTAGRLSNPVIDADVVVVGAGAVGACVALYAARRGASVILVDARRPGSGASFGNAGLVVPSYIVPLASVASAMEGLRSLWSRGQPVRIGLRLNARFVAWWARFVLCAAPAAVAASMATLHSFAQRSFTLHEELASSVGGYGFTRTGWMSLYRDRRRFEAAVRGAAGLERLGVRSEVLSPGDVRSLAPAAAGRIVGGINHPDDAHLEPAAFVDRIADACVSAGARIVEACPAALRVGRDRRIDVVDAATGARFRAGVCVLAAGVASVGLARAVGLALPIEAARGYSVTLAGEPPASMPLNLAEAHVVVTPMGDTTRLTTGLDFVGEASPADQTRLRLMRNAAQDYLGFDLGAAAKVWIGHRPMTPDSVPIVGTSARYPNLVIAAGHGTLGMTLAPATGELVAGLLGRAAESPDAARALSPARFGL